jgi:tetratricopeptide (TPR) repeat protein
MATPRYPGATPFNSKQSRIFYGRDRDIDRLLTLIRVEKKVLLYSRSGLGKTSLLEAGIIPRLPKEFIPVNIRFFASVEGAISPVERVIEALQKATVDFKTLPASVLDELTQEVASQHSLWYWFKKLQQGGFAVDSESGDEKVFFLVFDQFEELFTYPDKEILDFKNQFYDLTERRIPDAVATAIALTRESKPDLLNRQIISGLHHPLNVKTVMAIRSDRLSLLNHLSDKIPDIQQVFCVIEPLDQQQASDAIVKPALDPSPSLSSKPFTYHPAALEKIIFKLTDEGTQPIETTQLQIVCHRIEEIAMQKQTAAKDDRSVEIREEDLPEFKNIFLNFYNDSTGKLAPEEQPDARRLIEDELIRNSQRISLDEEICKDYITEASLKTLVNTHLLRAERNSFNRFSYEISHDTLVEPILESQKVYLQEQERLRLEEQQQQELKELREKQEAAALAQEAKMAEMQKEQHRKERERLRERRIQRTITFIVSIFLLISLGLGYWGFVNFCDAARQRDIAQGKEQEAVRNLIAFKNAQYNTFVSNATRMRRLADYDKAVESFEEAKRWLHAQVADPPINDTVSCNIFTMLFSGEDETISVAETNMQAIRTTALADSLKQFKALNDSIVDCQLLASRSSAIQQILAEANTYFAQKKFIASLDLLRRAYREDPNRSATAERFDDVKSEAIRAYQKDIKFYQEMNDQAELDRATRLLEEVRLIKM